MSINTQALSIAEQLARDRALRGWTLLQKEGVTHESMGMALRVGVFQGNVAPFVNHLIFPIYAQLVGLGGIIGPYRLYGFSFQDSEDFRFFDRLADARAQLILRDIPYTHHGSERTIRLNRPRTLGTLMDDLNPP